jgi:phytoene desaturase
MKHIVVIGAGTAGLASAIRLQTQGYQVTIIEKLSRVGGRMYRFEEKGFHFDVGPTIVMMPDIYREIFEMSGVKAQDYIDMTLLDPLYELHYPDGTSLTISSDLTKLIPALEEFSYEDTQGYLAYLADIYKRYNIARKGFIDRSFLTWKDILSWQNIRDTFRLRTLNSAYHSISKFVKNEKLRQALSFQTLYIGVSPFVGPSIYTIIPMIELLYGIWYIKGGMYAMAQAMEKRFLELGGHIRLNTSVDEVLIDKDQAVGVRMNQEKLQADGVLVNADFPWAVNQLIPKANRGRFHPKKLEKMQYSSSSFIMYFGLKKKFPTTVHQIRYAKDFSKNIADLFQWKIPEDASFYLYSPTQIDPSLAPEGKEILYVLVPTPNRQDPNLTWDQTMIQNLRNQIVNKIKQIPIFQDFEQFIEVEKIMTPKDWQEQFNLYHGATFGFKPILLQSNFFRPQVKALPVDRLYFAGTSTHPGAGIPIVMKSAKIAVDTIIKDIAL